MEMPAEIWADQLEDDGISTELLRAWLLGMDIHTYFNSLYRDSTSLLSLLKECGCAMLTAERCTEGRISRNTFGNSVITLDYGSGRANYFLHSSNGDGNIGTYGHGG